MGPRTGPGRALGKNPNPKQNPQPENSSLNEGIVRHIEALGRELGYSHMGDIKLKP